MTKHEFVIILYFFKYPQFVAAVILICIWKERDFVTIKKEYILCTDLLYKYMNRKYYGISFSSTRKTKFLV